LDPVIIALPPIDEQKEIACVLLMVDRRIQSEENRKSALKNLFKTMLHLLMTGQLRVKDLQIEN
jgi:type I restriction enzyme S subunit